MIIKKKHKIFIKIITLLLAVTFSFNFVFPTNLVYAASQYEERGLNGQGEGPQNGPKTKLGTLSQELSGHFKAIKEHANKKDTGSLRASVKTIKKALADSKKGIYQEFDDNEATLKKIGASTAVARQKAFRDQFQNKTAELESIIDELDSISNQGDTFDAIEASGLDEKLTRMQELITVEEEHNPLGSDLPHRNIQMQPPPPAIGNGISPAYMSSEMQAAGSSMPWLPTPEDLAETRETRFTPDIIEMADSLSNNPVEIYESVRNNITFEPYYGSRKGATGTLQQSSGNDFDQASLLIALFRYKNIPARYVTGTVEIPVDKVMSWTGADTTTAAVKTLGSMGIPVTSNVSGGGIESVLLQHTWVEAYVPYENYRGIGLGTGEAVWVPLDPSFKLNNKIEGLNLEEISGLDRQSIIDAVQGTGEMSDDGLTVTMLNFDSLNSQLDEASARLETYINENGLAQDSIKEIIGGLEIIPEFNEVLPLTLPYHTMQVSQEFAAVPDSLTDWVSFSIQGAGMLSMFSFSEDDFVYKASAPELYGKKITLSWVPATAEDENVLQAYGGVFGAPTYLVEMKAELKIDGQVVASGNPIQLGYKQNFKLTMSSPSTSGDEIVNPVKAGSFYAVGLDYQKIDSVELLNIGNKIKQIQQSVTEQNVYTDEVIGEILNGAAKAYFGQIDITNGILAETYNVKSTRFISEAVTGMEATGKYLFYAPVELSPGPMFIDVGRDTVSVVSRDGQSDDERAYMIASGMQASAMEHGIWEELLDMPAVSTIKILDEANQRGIPIYTVTSENINRVLPELEVSQAVKNDISNAVNSGRIVTIPKQNITYFDWNGTGYMMLDPESGAAAYMISGGIAGGMTAIAVNLSILVSLIIAALMFVDAVALLMATSVISQLFGLGLFVSAEYYLIDVLVQVCRYYTGDSSAGANLITTAMLGATFSGGFKLAGALTKVVKNMFGKEIGKLTFESWQASEAYLLKKVGGQAHVFFKTSSGAIRYVDVLDPTKIAHEAKLGYAPLTDFIRKQIEKDVILISEGKIEGAVWNFYRSTKTGRIGPSEPLKKFIDEFKKKGINIDYKIHY